MRMPSIARGTVYRNLKLMEQDHEIARLEMPSGPDRYDRTTAPHGHLYCDCCHSLTDIPVVGLVRELEAAIGTEVRSYHLTVHYLCPRLPPQPGAVNVLPAVRFFRSAGFFFP